MHPLELFTIRCATCGAGLKVRQPQIIGEIVACPKCASMVHLAPPPGWTMPESGEQSSTETPASTSSDGATSDEPAESLPAAAAWLSPSEQALRKWSLLAGLPVAAIVVLASGWIYFARSSENTPREAPAAAVPSTEVALPDETPAAERATPEPAPPAPALALDRRWLPADSRAVLSVRLASVSDHDGFHELTARLGPLWRDSIGEVLRSFRFDAASVERLTWAATDFAELSDGVVILHLAPQADIRLLNAESVATDQKLGDHAARRLRRDDWPHPFMIVDERTVVSAPLEQLTALAEHAEEPLASPGIDHLLAALDAGRHGLLAVDLAAARQARGEPLLPGLGAWEAGRDSWSWVRERPTALGANWHLASTIEAKLALVCDSRSDAETLEASLVELARAAHDALTKETATLVDQLRAGALRTATAHHIEFLLDAGRQALANQHIEIVETTVWLHAQYDGDPARLVMAAVAASPALEERRLAAARAGDEARHRGLLSALDGFQKGEGRYPAGAAGATLLRPETRLSWLATMLPYFGHADWHRELNVGRPWNDAANGLVTRRELPAVVNPAFGPARNEADFPVTHYVGLAGVGADASDLAASDPRAGMFGARRRVVMSEIADGTSNTIAILGVSGKLGPWGAGGESTVRPLTTEPYIDGPDGFGSGQPDGMTAGMADGSVRFFSRDVDPHVLRQLATIRGGERVDLTALPDPENPRPANTTDPVEPTPVAEAPRRTLTERPAALPNFEARLATRIAAIDEPRISIADLVEMIASLGAVQITFDLDALAEAGVQPDDQVAVKLTDTNLGEILETALRPLGLELLIDEHNLIVTSPSRQRTALRDVRYSVDDLTAGDADALGRLAELIRRLIEPTSWREAGGDGQLAIDQGAIVVRHGASVHRDLFSFLENLRRARRLPTRDQRAVDAPLLSSRTTRAAERLARPITANFRQAAPLSTLIARLQDMADVNLVVDWLALGVDGVPPDVEASLSVDRRPLSETLTELTRPLNLGWRVVGDRMIEITTPAALAAKPELEFYAIGPSLGEDRSAQALIDAIKSRVAPRSWSDAGGSAALEFDAPSGYLIVLQTQAAQVEIEDLLETLTAPTTPPHPAP